jgi:hypothetical protein
MSSTKHYNAAQMEAIMARFGTAESISALQLSLH